MAPYTERFDYAMIGGLRPINPHLIADHIGSRVRVRLVPRGSLVGEVLDADDTAISLLLGDGTAATIPIAAISNIRSQAAWARRAG